MFGVRSGSASTGAAAYKIVPRRRKSRPRGPVIFRPPLRNGSTCRWRARIPSYARLKITASRRLPPLPKLPHSMIVGSSPPEKVVPFIVRREKMRRVGMQVEKAQATTRRAPEPSIRMSFRRPSVLLLQTREIPSRTANTKNSKRRFTRSRKKSGKNSSSSRNVNTRGSPDNRPMMPEGSRSNIVTSNRPSNYNNGNPSASNVCRKKSSRARRLRRPKKSTKHTVGDSRAGCLRP